MSDLFEDKILPRYEQHRGDWLAEARRVALELGRQRERVCVDDVRRICPPPAGQDPRVMGAIFRSGPWQKVGMSNSQRRTCHNRPISWFSLVEEGGEA